MQDYKLMPDVPEELIRGDNYDYMRVVAYCQAMRNPFMTGRYGLLSVGKDAKTKKGEKYGVLTGVLYLAPAQLSGHEVCKGRTKGCSAVCLWTAGHGAYSNVQLSRIKKTMSFHYDIDVFMKQLDVDILQLAEEARERSMEPAVRLNGTSDIDWTKIPLFDYNYRNIFEVHENIRFYDYTKRVQILENAIDIDNYYIVFSRAETKKNHRDAQKALEMGYNITVVFGGKRLPDTYMGYTVIDGDTSDMRFYDNRRIKKVSPVVVGLLAKGKARNDKGKDRSGFVVWPGDEGYNS